jgi:hypothetical protein
LASHAGLDSAKVSEIIIYIGNHYLHAKLLASHAGFVSLTSHPVSNVSALVCLACKGHSKKRAFEKVFACVAALAKVPHGVTRRVDPLCSVGYDLFRVRGIKDGKRGAKALVVILHHLPGIGNDYLHRKLLLAHGTDCCDVASPSCSLYHNIRLGPRPCTPQQRP